MPRSNSIHKHVAIPYSSAHVTLRDDVGLQELCYPILTDALLSAVFLYSIHMKHFWLAVHGKPVLFWKGISGLKCPCFLFYAC